jgi:hypothetical protein
MGSEEGATRSAAVLPPSRYGLRAFAAQGPAGSCPYLPSSIPAGAEILSAGQHLLL